MKFRPLHDRVVIRRIEGEDKTKGGIIIPDTAKEKPQEGEVVAVGPGARDEAGKLVPIDLKPRDRSLLNLGMIACLGRMHEFEAHFRGALRNGLTHKELSAILRQVAIYCGFPAAVDCHRVAKQVLAAAAKKS